MNRLKTFAKYLGILIAFYIFSTVLSIGFIVTTYKDISGELEKDAIIEIEVKQAKATFVNGNIVATLSNPTDVEVVSKYIKIDLISEKENKILTKYIQINELSSMQEKEITVNFRAENIKKYKISVVDEYVQEEKTELISLVSAENESVKNISILLAAIILLNYVIL